MFQLPLHHAAYDRFLLLTVAIDEQIDLIIGVDHSFLLHSAHFVMLFANHITTGEYVNV
jgi:hypothetical protein